MEQPEPVPIAPVVARACASIIGSLRHVSESPSTPQSPSLQILTVIVNYRSAPLTIACLQSLADERQHEPGLRVVVVDNPSGDDSVATLRTAIDSHEWADWVTVLPMPKNGGFAYGVNAGVQPALASDAPPDAFWLLNPDTYIRPGALTALQDHLLRHPEASMVGSRLEDPDGTPQHSRFRFPNLANELDGGLRLGLVGRLIGDRATCPPITDTPHEIDWLSGASMLVRREVFEKTGAFDEGYFLYFEELDFCHRAHALGFRSFYVPASRVVHLVGQTTGVTVRDRRPGRVPAYWFESRSRYLRKFHGRIYKLTSDVLFIGSRLVFHALRTLRWRANTDPPRQLGDFVRHNFRLVGRPRQQ